MSNDSKMEKSTNKKAIYNSIELFKNNIRILQKQRPDIIFDYQEDGTASVHGFEGSSKDYWEEKNVLQAFNVSLIFNCFSLFEASFESLLLDCLSLKGLAGIQREIMIKYIEDIIKLSSKNRYEKEFKFVFGKSIKEYLGAEYYDKYKTIISFYTLRHILIHGSGFLCDMVPVKTGHEIVISNQDNEYKILLKLLNEKINMKFSNQMFPDSIICVNAVIDLLIDSTLEVSKKITSEINYGILILR